MIDLAKALELLLVTDDEMVAGRSLADVCTAAVRGGVTSVQLRLKRASGHELHEVATTLIATLDVPVFINDRLDVALAAGAAGAHLGADDVPPTLARRIVPPGFVIGASVGSDEEIGRGGAADYWGIGPLHITSTKSDAGAVLGLEGATRLLRAAGSRPCVVIGGVVPDDVSAVRAAGFAGVAVVSGILRDADTETAARRYSMGR